MESDNRFDKHPCELEIDSLLQQCKFTRTRASGPGGQHRNKVETAVVVEHLPSGIIGQASEARSQDKNRKVAIARLRVNLALGIRTTRCQISPLWSDRTIKGKLKVNPDHEDYAPVLAEALDVVWQNEFEVVASAAALNISTSQLIKFIKTCSAAFATLNRLRNENGKHSLR